MEFEKIKLHRSVKTGAAVTQITLDDDYNVPDYRQDIVKVIKQKGELRFDEIKAANGAAWMKGSLVFKVLYRSDKQEGKISCLRGEIPFQEKLNMDGLNEYDTIHAQGDIEDLSIGVIHSRKLSIRAVIILSASAETEVDEELNCGLVDNSGYEQNIVEREALKLLALRRDLCRQKSEVVLPSSKPNIREILWQSMELRNIESRLTDGNVQISGEVAISVIYNEEEEGERLSWYETTLPLATQAECGIFDEDCICRVQIRPATMELEVKPDYDGEERILVMELALDTQICIWKEEKINLLTDLYSLNKEVKPVQKACTLERLLVRNAAKCRLSERMELQESQEKVLQICACEGNVMLERQELTENGVLAEGMLFVNILYITPDDHMPVGAVEDIYPFSQLIEVPEMSDSARIELDIGLEQLSAVMLDQTHIEIKAAVRLDLIAFVRETLQNVETASEEEPDLEALRSRPGLVGYIAKDGDELWTIAKENHTTIRDIMETNQRKSEKLAAGDKILIVKQIGIS